MQVIDEMSPTLERDADPAVARMGDIRTAQLHVVARNAALQQGSSPIVRRHAAAELARIGWDEVDGRHSTVCAHFLGFLVDLHGIDAVIAFLGGDVSRGGDVDAAFETAFDMTLQEADELWIGWSLVQSWGRPRDRSREMSFDGGPMVLQGALDCDDAETVGGADGVHSRRSCLRFSEDTPVRVSVTGDEGVVARLIFTACGQEKLLPKLVDEAVPAGSSRDFDTLRLTMRCSHLGPDATRDAVRLLDRGAELVHPTSPAEPTRGSTRSGRSRGHARNDR
jgi:hypothetical protein